MHVLTKIFVVLVSLLAVVLTPLVVVYAHNEDSYKSRHEDARLTAEALRTELDTSAVIVAQRMSTIELADRVVFLEGGSVAGVGSHAELLHVPAYRSLVEAYAEAA